MKQVQVLPLIFVYAFDLNVEETRRIDNHLCDAFDVLCKVHFVALLHFMPFFSERRIHGEGFELPQLIEIVHPAGADGLCNEICKPRVRQQYEPSMAHTVRLVAEFMVHDVEEIREDLLFQQLCMQF